MKAYNLYGEGCTTLANHKAKTVVYRRIKEGPNGGKNVQGKVRCPNWDKRERSRLEKHNEGKTGKIKNVTAFNSLSGRK